MTVISGANYLPYWYLISDRYTILWDTLLFIVLAHFRQFIRTLEPTGFTWESKISTGVSTFELINLHIVPTEPATPFYDFFICQPEPILMPRIYSSSHISSNDFHHYSWHCHLQMWFFMLHGSASSGRAELTRGTVNRFLCHLYQFFQNQQA